MSVQSNLFTPKENSLGYLSNPFNRVDPKNMDRPPLPNEIALNILKYLSPSEAHRFMTCTESEMGMQRIENHKLIFGMRSSLNTKELIQYQRIFSLEQPETVKPWRDIQEKEGLYLQNLRHLDLSGYHLTFQEFAAILSMCPNLTSIILGDSISREVLQEIGRNFPNLQSISLPGNFAEDYTENAVIDLLIANFNHLTSITFTGRSSSNDDGIQRLAQKFQNLTSFSIGGSGAATYFSDAVLDAFINYCPNMTQLKIEGSNDITDEGVIKCAIAYPKLTKLGFPQCSHVSDESIKAIARYCPALTSIDFKCCNITDAGAKIIAESFPNLTSINLFGAEYISSNTFQTFAKNHPNLKEICLACNQAITDRELDALATNCPKLSVIDLHYCDKLTNTGINQLAKCANLTKIRLSVRYHITPAGITSLFDHPNLNWVDLLPAPEIEPSAYNMFYYPGLYARETREFEQARKQNYELSQFKKTLSARGVYVEKPVGSQSLSKPLFD